MQVSIWLVRAIINSVERAGASRNEFLALARIDPELVERGEARLLVDDYKRAIEAAITVTADPALGLHLGEHASPAMYRVVAHLVDHAATLGEGIAMMIRYSGLLATGYEPCLFESGERVALRLPYLIGASGATQLTAEFALTGFMRMFRQYVGPNARPYSASFAYPAPAHAAEYRRIFGGVERFDQPYTEMEFPRGWLARSQLYSDPALHAVLKTHAERELSQLERGGTVVERVQLALASSDLRALPTMTALARELSISARTLARRLSVEGMTYATLVESRQMSAATSLLEGRQLTIQEIADVMGFASAPAFHRAFRRWTGLTPKQYVFSVPSVGRAPVETAARGREKAG